MLIDGHSTVYRPNLRAKSDTDILRDAKLEAMGLPPQDDLPHRSNQERAQMATDELVGYCNDLIYARYLYFDFSSQVMERFKKRMRK